MDDYRNLKIYTVVHTHDMPFGGVAQYLCCIVRAETAQEAGNKCISALGGYGTVIAIFQGNLVPELVSGNPITNIWSSLDGPSKAKQLPSGLYEPVQNNPARIIKSITRTTKRAKKKKTSVIR